MDAKQSNYGKEGEYLDGEEGMVRHSEYNLASGNDQLQRGLKSRHIQFLALGMETGMTLDRIR
jgi:amino acid permease